MVASAVRRAWWASSRPTMTLPFETMVGAVETDAAKPRRRQLNALRHSARPDDGPPDSRRSSRSWRDCARDGPPSASASSSARAPPAPRRPRWRTKRTFWRHGRLPETATIFKKQHTFGAVLRSGSGADRGARAGVGGLHGVHLERQRQWRPRKAHDGRGRDRCCARRRCRHAVRDDPAGLLVAECPVQPAVPTVQRDQQSASISARAAR